MNPKGRPPSRQAGRAAWSRPTLAIVAALLRQFGYPAPPTV
jgi:hypothetical protein